MLPITAGAGVAPAAHLMGFDRLDVDSSDTEVRDAAAGLPVFDVTLT